MFYFAADRDYMIEAHIIKFKTHNLKIWQYRTSAILESIFFGY